MKVAVALTRTDYETDLDVVTLFDNLGRQTSRVDAAGTWSWTYDAGARGQPSR